MDIKNLLRVPRKTSKWNRLHTTRTWNAVCFKRSSRKWHSRLDDLQVIEAEPRKYQLFTARQSHENKAKSGHKLWMCTTQCKQHLSNNHLFIVIFNQARAWIASVLACRIRGDSAGIRATTSAADLLSNYNRIWHKQNWLSFSAAALSTQHFMLRVNQYRLSIAALLRGISLHFEVCLKCRQKSCKQRWQQTKADTARCGCNQLKKRKAES